jgi:Flp pilus assembly protein TadB
VGEKAGEPSSGTRRRLAVALFCSLTVTVVGRVAVWLWGGWLAVPFVLGFVGILIVLTLAEARARRVAATQLLKETLKRMGRRST